jgi:hypothetical protein
MLSAAKHLCSRAGKENKDPSSSLLIRLSSVIAREAKPTAAIQDQFQMDCFVAMLLAMTCKGAVMAVALS